MPEIPGTTPDSTQGFLSGFVSQMFWTAAAVETIVARRHDAALSRRLGPACSCVKNVESRGLSLLPRRRGRLFRKPPSFAPSGGFSPVQVEACRPGKRIATPSLSFHQPADVTGPMPMTGSGELRALHARNAIQAAPAARIVFLTAAIYFLFGRLGLALAILPGNETLILPAAGIALAAAILRGRDARLGVFLGAFLLDISSHADFDEPKSLPLAVALAMAIGAIASAQAAIGAWLVRRSRAFPIAPATPMSVALLFALGGVVAGLIGATLCLCLFRAAGRVASGDLLQFWAVQSGGEAVGVIVQTPLILSFAGAPGGPALATRGARLPPPVWRHSPPPSP